MANSADIRLSNEQIRAASGKALPYYHSQDEIDALEARADAYAQTEKMSFEDALRELSK